jgi:hypothetical protein
MTDPITPEKTSEPAALVEDDVPNVRVIGVAVVVILSLVVAIVVGLGQLFSASVRDEIKRKQLVPENSVLRAARAEEQAKLNRTQWVDQRAGIVRIPLGRARALVLEDYAKGTPK